MKFPSLDTILQPISRDVSKAFADAGHGHFVSALEDLLRIPEDVDRSIESSAAETVDSLYSSSSPRPRTGNPYTDNLIGIEPNPGPDRKKGASLPRRKSSVKQGIGGQRRLSSNNRQVTFRGGGTSSSIRSIAAPMGIGSAVAGNGLGQSLRHRSGRLHGSPCHFITGTCAFQNYSSNAGSGAVFQDGSGNQSVYVYLNPRICCQNAGYGTPLGLCPIGVVSQPWRKFCFTKLRIHYVPTVTSTAQVGAMALAFDPEVITTSSLSSSAIMAYANFESSMYGPMWNPNSLDVTPFLDKSKWYYGETPVAVSTSLLSSESIQGTLLLCGTTLPAVSTTYGMFFMEFELALSELGPVEVFTAPALRRPPVARPPSSLTSSTSPSYFAAVEPCSGKDQSDTTDTAKDKAVTEVVTEEYIIVDGERKLVNRTSTRVV